MVKKLWFILGHYPTPSNPDCAFLRPVITGLADRGVDCTVISAQSLTQALVYHHEIMPFQWFDETERHNRVRILQPKYISFSGVKFRGISVSNYLRMLAVRRALRRLDGAPDLLYCHFWYVGAVGALATGAKYPMLVVSGEEHIDVLERFDRRSVELVHKKLRGVICVSGKNLRESAALGLLPQGVPTAVLPNAADAAVFHPMDRQEARRKLGLDPDAPIAVFVGSFEERKGVLRVVEAARRVPALRLMLIGRGPQKPESDQIVFQGPVPHAELNTYLNAADMFVLPTLAEGCCNAIVEALVCGLPVISSDRDFNDDILNPGNSLRIDPTSIDALADALRTLCEQPDLRRQLSQGALASAQALRIDARVDRILDFINRVAAPDQA